MKKPRILIIDDEPDAGRILSKILEEDGFSVQVAASGEEGLKRLKQDPSDVVLLDLILPKMGGLEALREIKAIRPGSAVLMMTGHESVKTAVEAMKLGAHDYLTKPLPVERLGQILRQVIQVRSYNHAALGESQKRGDDTLVHPNEWIGEDTSTRKVLDLLRQIAPQEITVLIRGESGTGKERLARMIHALSLRREKPFVALDCATLPESLFESEVFGYERGAFTGAEATKIGRFEQADEGTLFLDEIGNLSVTAQAKLLRVLQEREITRLGSHRSIRVDVRILTATNQDLELLMTRGLFREDLFHRLNVFAIHLPPLRERGDDVFLLSHHFRERFNQEFGKKVSTISSQAMSLLARYDWPGNVRELENTMRSAILLAQEKVLPEHLPQKVRDFGGLNRAAPSPQNGRLKEFVRAETAQREKQFILSALRASLGNKRQAAKKLGIDYKTLFNKLKALGISPEEIAATKQEKQEIAHGR